MLSKLYSRKLWVTIITGVLVAFNKKAGLNLSEEAIMALAGLSAAYVIGMSYVDKSDG